MSLSTMKTSENCLLSFAHQDKLLPHFSLHMILNINPFSSWSQTQELKLPRTISVSVCCLIFVVLLCV